MCTPLFLVRSVLQRLFSGQFGVGLQVGFFDGSRQGTCIFPVLVLSGAHEYARINKIVTTAIMYSMHGFVTSTESTIIVLSNVRCMILWG